ncbi:MAG: class I SAM-dependent methyltransferase [Pseudomonadales bacterium]
MSLKHWQTYYRTGALATCPTGPDGTYDLEVKAAWVEFFSAQSDGARILDIGTGNGAIALIAKETAAALGRQYEIHGTDLADIDPYRDVPNGAQRFEGIEFHAGIATENLPFEANYFDGICAQYALEYMKIGEALTEIQRVLAPGGQACFILHHTDSVIVQNARESLRQTDLVLKETRIYRLLGRYLAAFHKSSPNTSRHLEALMNAGETLKQAALSSNSTLILRETLEAVQRLVNARARMPLTVLEQEVNRVEEELRAAVTRLKDLCQCALAETDLESIARDAREAGLQLVETNLQLHRGGNLVGWRLELEKPGNSAHTAAVT